MDMSAMIVKNESLKHRNHMSSVYSVTVRGIKSNIVAEPAISMWVNPKYKDRFATALAQTPVAVSLLGVYVQKKADGSVVMSMSDDSRISMVRTWATTLLECKQGRSSFVLAESAFSECDSLWNMWCNVWPGIVKEDEPVPAAQVTDQVVAMFHECVTVGASAMLRQRSSVATYVMV